MLVKPASLALRLLSLLCGAPLAHTDPAQASGEQSRAPLSLTADQFLALGAKAEADGNNEVALSAYRALSKDPSVEVRSEGRFRHAMLLVRLRRLQESAILLREILDEQPHAQRVRLELARVLELMGDEAGARRALREAQAGGLPPEVARFIDRYSAALRARKPFGAAFEVALAPDTNINRATRSETLGTVFGDFTVDDGARQRSGIGLALRGQVYGRNAIGPDLELLARASGSADIYRDRAFNDVAIGLSAGPELAMGRDRLTLELGGQARWYGGDAYSRAVTVSINYLHPVGRRAQLRLASAASLIDNRINPLQDGHYHSASASFERALSNRSGIGASAAFDRQDLRDPGYSSVGGQLTLFGYRELGSTTMFASFAYGGLRADRRLLLYPVRRSDSLLRASLGATLRRLKFGGFAPFVRLVAERNASTIEIYDYDRLRTEIGLTRAF